jgi:hypothetical protein
VPARNLEAKVLHEALSSGAWHQHHGNFVAMTAIDRRSWMTQHLGWQCGLPAVCRRGGRRRDATGSSQRLAWSTLALGVAGISQAGSAASSRGRGWVWEGTRCHSGSGA